MDVLTELLDTLEVLSQKTDKIDSGDMHEIEYNAGFYHAIKLRGQEADENDLNYLNWLKEFYAEVLEDDSNE